MQQIEMYKEQVEIRDKKLQGKIALENDNAQKLLEEVELKRKQVEEDKKKKQMEL